MIRGVPVLRCLHCCRSISLLGGTAPRRERDGNQAPNRRSRHAGDDARIEGLHFARRPDRCIRQRRHLAARSDRLGATGVCAAVREYLGRMPSGIEAAGTVPLHLQRHDGERRYRSVRVLAAAHAGMTSDQFAALVHEWFDSASDPHVNRPYADLAYLRANGFKSMW